MVRKTYTIADIYNLALERVGCRKLKRTDCLDDTVQEVQVLNLFFQHVFEKVLEEWKWNFATKITPLVEDDDYDCSGTGFEYAYIYPSDCIFARKLEGDTPFRIVSDTSGVGYTLLTNQQPATLEYTCIVSDTPLPICPV